MSDQEQNSIDTIDTAEEQTEQHDSEDNNRGINPVQRYILFAVLAVIIIGAGIYGWHWWQYASTHESTKNAQIEGHISPVIPRVDGYVANVYVDDNEKVAKGELLATIDTSNYQVDVRRAQAGIAGVKASYQDAKAHLETVKAQKNQANVQVQQTKTEYERQKRLMQDHSTTQQKLDHAKFAYQTARAQYKVAQQQVKSAHVKIQQAKAQIGKAQAALDNAQLQLSYTALRAPIPGRVSKKNIEAGQYVRAGNQVMAIAQDDNVWVVANFKEGQIAGIKVGQPVRIKVDAYSDTTYQGTVQSIAGATGSKFALLPPDNASGNFVKVEQRIPVKIVFKQADPLGPTGKLLKPGMNVKPTIDISKQ
jgi:membrane fusion protein (multidrug efflux system)